VLERISLLQREVALASQGIGVDHRAVRDALERPLEDTLAPRRAMGQQHLAGGYRVRRDQFPGVRVRSVVARPMGKTENRAVAWDRYVGDAAGALVKRADDRRRSVGQWRPLDKVGRERHDA